MCFCTTRSRRLPASCLMRGAAPWKVKTTARLTTRWPGAEGVLPLSVVVLFHHDDDFSSKFALMRF